MLKFILTHHRLGTEHIQKLNKDLVKYLMKGLNLFDDLFGDL
jgi:hypothetical protein